MNTILERLDCSADGDYQGTCRVCMTTCNVYPNNLFEGNNYDILKKIEFCTGILFKKENGFPSQICKLCMRNLSTAYKFKTKCLQSEEIFRKQSKIKIEITVPKKFEDDCNFNDSDYFDSKIDQSTDINMVKQENIVQDVLIKVEKVEPSESFIERKDEKPSIDVKNLTRLKNIQWKQRPKYRKLYCRVCKLFFQDLQELTKHRKELHKRIRKTDGTKSWMCDICGKCYVHRTSLDTHVASHFTPQNECDYCGYQTCYKNDLIKHIRIHTGDKKFKCDQCTCAFHNSSNLYSHIRGFHQRIRRFVCQRPNCGKAFFDKSQLKRHLNSHDSFKGFKCDICHSVLSARSHWKRHLLQKHKVLIPRAKAGRKKQSILVGELDSDRDKIET